ncbi:hypothetical protein TWF696_001087 [Orbilia brochopaga]|uniref:Uncharacterized protein n=1 Tax=Orbilia brochopaga TaxID=3140254 RepID=A0AAV9VDQ8_9PEZI
MRATVLSLALAISAASAQTAPPQPSISAAPGSLPVGAQCSDDAQCANGAQCYGVTSFTIRTCGSFQSVCTSDAQCATNTCNNGFCNGVLGGGDSSSVTTAPTETSSVVGPSIPPQSTVIAAPGSLPLGAQCSSKEQCANGADCYGVTAFTITTCGSFQSVCTSDNQCATNTCNNGFCNGPLPSGSSLSTYAIPTGASTGSPTGINTSAAPYPSTGNGTGTGTGTGNNGGNGGGNGGNGGNGGAGSTLTSAPASGATGGSSTTTGASPTYTGAAVAFDIPRGAAAIVAIVVAGLAL